MCPSPDDRAGRPDEGGSEQPLEPAGRAVSADTFVREEEGQWIVDIVVAFPDGVVRRSVNKYRTRRHAEIAASWIRRAADRDIEGPVHD